MKCIVQDCDNLQESRLMCMHHVRRSIQGLVYEGTSGDMVDHCLNGHELVGENVRWEPSGKGGKGGKRRRCRACLRERGRNQARTKLVVVEPPAPYRPDDATLTAAIDDFADATEAVKGKCWNNPGPYMDWDENNVPSPEQAKAFCAGCPLLMACGNYAIAAKEWHGVWGGRVIHEGTVL